MSDGIYVALSGAIAKARHLEAVSANLSNVETSGYRKLEPAFREYLAEARPGGQAPDAVYPGQRLVPVDRAHVVIGGGKESTRAGALIETGSPLDFALEGSGFFSLKTTGGTRYTRNGHFLRRADGVLAAADGAPVLGTKGEIRLPEGELEVAVDGTITVAGKKLDRLKLVDFTDPKSLSREGVNRYRTTAKPTAADAAVRTGRLEGSNVRPVPELIAMIEIQRTFEALQEAIRSYREIDGRANDVGRPA